MRSVNLIPFNTVRLYMQGYDSYYSKETFETLSFVNMMGNVMLFVPLGILFPIVFSKANKWYHVLLAGAALSVFIEFMQYFVERSTDIDDVIVNVLGTLIGFICYCIISKVVKLIKSSKESNRN